MVVINEIESNGGNPGDWVELYNAGTMPANIGGYVFKDSNDANAYVIPMGTTLAPQAYFVLNEAAFGFGLGDVDAASLLYPGGAVIIDSYTWTEHAQTTLGRCPNGVGMFAVTMSPSKGVPNDCVW